MSHSRSYTCENHVKHQGGRLGKRTGDRAHHNRGRFLVRSENNPSQTVSSLVGCQSKFLCTPRGAGPPEWPLRLSLLSHGPQPRTRPCSKGSDKSCNHELCSWSGGSRNVAIAKELSQACHDAPLPSLPAHALFSSTAVSDCCISVVWCTFLAGSVACLSQNSSQDYKSGAVLTTMAFGVLTNYWEKEEVEKKDRRK